jgi:hypothetical protein
MNYLEQIRQAVEDTTLAAYTYRVADHDVVELEVRARTARIGARDSFHLGALQRAILDIAEQHHADCAAGGCRTCAAIRYGLTATLASLRVMADDERAREAVSAQRGKLLNRSA